MYYIRIFMLIVFGFMFFTPANSYAQSHTDFAISPLLIILAILFVVFLLVREFLCWYWKINKIVYIQDKIVDLLKDLIISCDGEVGAYKKLNKIDESLEKVNDKELKDID